MDMLRKLTPGLPVIHISAWLLTVIAAAHGQEPQQGDLIRCHRISTAQILGLSIDSEGGTIAVLEVDPYDISIRSLGKHDEFRSIAHTSMGIRDFCLADAGATLLIGGDNLRTWNWRIGIGRVLDGDRNPEFLVSNVLAANDKTGQIAAAGRLGLYLASDSTGKDGQWTNVPGLWTAFTDDGKYLVVQCPERVCVYEPKNAELGNMTATFRELDSATKRLTSEVDVYDRASGKSRAAIVTRGAIEARARGSICVVDDVIYTSFSTQIWGENRAGDISDGWFVETWAHPLDVQSQVLTVDEGRIPDRCMLGKGISADVFKIGANSQASPHLVELSPCCISLTPIAVSRKSWQIKDEKVIRIDTIPGLSDAELGGASCFAISKKKNSVLVGYRNGYLAEWQL